MKLAAIINLWDGEELLTGAIECFYDHVDKIIIVWQGVSNFGEFHDPMRNFLSGFIKLKSSKKEKIIFERYEPSFSLGGSQNEVKKRNIGLDIARAHECTHFFHIDVDEYYENFAAAKKEFVDSGKRGSVCPIYTYFKKPIWRLENLDSYYVPFIHELQPDTRAGNSSYPFYCDPTRTIIPHETQSEIHLMSYPMHHFSWVRNDINRKARNSSAGQHGNKLKGLLNDYHSPELESNPEGYQIKDMGNQRIKIVDDLFGISK